MNGLIVFARMGSKRLPRKALLDVAGRPLLGRVLDRARRVKDVVLVVATTGSREDDRIAQFVETEKVPVFRGSETDVADRALRCARAFGFERFGRVTGDSPFMDPGMFARLLKLHEHEGLDVATNVFPRTFPMGLSAEVIATEALERALALTDAPYDREHVTPAFYNSRSDFRIRNVAAPAKFSVSVKLAVDTTADLERAAWIAERLGPEAATADTARVIDLARRYDRERATA